MEKNRNKFVVDPENGSRPKLKQIVEQQLKLSRFKPSGQSVGKLWKATSEAEQPKMI